MLTSDYAPIAITDGTRINRNARFAMNLAHTFNAWFDPKEWKPTLFHVEGWFECVSPEGNGMLVSIDGRKVQPIAMA